jgi:hypothetical protein
LFCSGVSQRRAAQLLNIHLTTVARKLKFIAAQARISQELFVLNEYKDKKVMDIHFDDLETSHHTKCKPLSVSLAVENHTRKVLGFEISIMPAKGKIAKISMEKYGFRPDHRPDGLRRMFQKLSTITSPKAKFTSDQNPLYAPALREWFPEAKHDQVKARRGCVVGQGELKKIGFDPLFSLNHTCAMLRANINRLFRRTWCTTKKIESLADHISIYIDFHNQVLT